MSKRMLLLNILLLVGCVYLGRMVYQDFSEFDNTHKVVAVEPESAENKGADSKALAVQSPSPVTPSENMVISEKNLFLESRSLQAATAVPVPEVAPALNPKPMLMGVAMVGSEPRAFVQNVRAQPGQRSTKILKVGEAYEGYKVAQIQRGRVELSYTSPSGNVTTQVLDINDAANRAARTAARTPLTPSQVISIGSQNAATVAAQQVPAIDDQNRRVIRTPFGDVTAPPGMQGAPARALPINPANQNRLLQQQEQQLQQQSQQQSQQSRTETTPMRRNEVIDEQGRRVIRTPFGDIIRPMETPPQSSPPTTIPPQPN
jgi:hypothetical protein